MTSCITRPSLHFQFVSVQSLFSLFANNHSSVEKLGRIYHYQRLFKGFLKNNTHPRRARNREPILGGKPPAPSGDPDPEHTLGRTGANPLVFMFKALIFSMHLRSQRWTRIGSIRGSGRVGSGLVMGQIQGDFRESGRVAGQTCHCRNFFHYISLKLNLICCSKCGFVIPIIAAAEASGFGYTWLSSAGGNL